MGNDSRLALLVKESFQDFPSLDEWTKIVEKNSNGKIWIIGGFVYRNIINKLNGLDLWKDKEQIDIDFLVEGLARKFYPPRGWELMFTDYENPYFVKGRYRLDINSLRNFRSIQRRELPPRLSHFFTGTPLNIQSIAYDFYGGYDFNGEIDGWRGIEAIKNRRVKINNLEEAKYEAKQKRITLNRLVRNKAEELGFEYSLGD